MNGPNYIQALCASQWQETQHGEPPQWDSAAGLKLSTCLGWCQEIYEEMNVTHYSLFYSFWDSELLKKKGEKGLSGLPGPRVRTWDVAYLGLLNCLFHFIFYLHP